MRGKRQTVRGRRLWARVFHSVRGRATVITVVLAALVLDVCVALALMLVRDVAQSSASDSAARTVERVVYRLTVEGRARPPEPGAGDAPYIQIVGADHRVLASTPDLAGRPPLVRTYLERGELLVERQACPSYLDSCVEVFGMRMAESPYGRGVMVLAAQRPSPFLRGWRLPLEIGLLLLTMLTAIAWWTWRTIGVAFAPVEAIRDQMAEINTTADLKQRVPEPGTGGEIQELAETVNHTLERLEEAAGRERRFVSDASHDLRNPIAGMHMRLENLLEEDDGFAWKPEVRAALRDTERLNDIVADLLELSRLDSRAPAPKQRVDLADLVRREVERRQGRVPIETRLAEGAVVSANPVRLARVLGNLVSNAERHADSRVEVTVAVDGREAVLEVLDDGAGVPPEARERVFERFARLADSRRRDPAGTGLGLPIAREIAQTYGGSLRIADSPRGARFVFRLPLASAGVTAAR
ncbi:sensor histidine kinase [Actinomadura hibisca]|uniref:sensor histidine kinase n=1 Tax=Actinomadura hibisca TaxID=68565 RepID=UPI00082C0C48|nr:HAMP domain-containing sensor histidine kinase [Actinomadura hibisca]